MELNERMKKIFLISLLIFGIYSYNLKAVSLSMGFLGQFAVSGASSNKSFPSDFRDFDSGFTFLIGANQRLIDTLSITVLAEVGYYHDTYDFKHNINGNRRTENYQFDSFLIGAVGRFHFSFFSLGLGGGVKIPISAIYRSDKDRYYLSRGDIKDLFQSSVIPYVKASLDFNIFNYISLGLYVNYDFPMKFQQNTFMDGIIINKNYMTGFDIGIQFGYFVNFENYNR